MSFIPAIALLTAQAAPSAVQSILGGPNQMFLLLAIFGGIFWFMIVRPQRKQEATLKKFVDGLQKGDEVVTNGGIIGKVDKVQDLVVFLEVASNVRIRIMKSQVLGPFVPAVAPDAAKIDAAKTEAPEKK